MTVGEDATDDGRSADGRGSAHGSGSTGGGGANDDETAAGTRGSRLDVLSIVGARPQFVKAFPVSRALAERGHEETLVHTGQHYDDELSEVFFRDLPLPVPEHDLGVGSDDHARQTAAMLHGLADVLDEAAPDVVVVYGDTNSTLAGAVAASKRDHELVHVEAGLRSDDMGMPEEVNRRLTDHAADRLLAPGESAADRLAAEDVPGTVAVTGDVMYDALLDVRERASERSSVLAEFGLTDGEYVLATVHRAANTDDPDRLAGVVEGLAAAPLPVVLPLHPRTDEALREHGLYETAADALELVDPVGYLDFARLLDGAERVATDSGGVQKEAFYLDTRCVTLRDRTEWTETVEAGWNVLVGADPVAIRDELARDDALPEQPRLYGGGGAAERVVAAIEGREPEGGR
jgi:UDP-N-acetylglucosamine 2-epimerase (non-hydrolysing)